MSIEERLEENGREAYEADAITPQDAADGQNEVNADVAAEEPFEEADGDEDGEEDYARLAEEDMRELAALFPSLIGKKSITELENPVRYAALRDLGLSPKEAYLATTEPVKRYDNRSHLRSAVPHGAGGGIPQMSTREMDEARELFCGLSDREIRQLYKKVTK